MDDLKEKMILDKIELLATKLDANTRLTENVIQQVSGVGSDLKAFKQEMKPWLEAKIGLNLLFRWFITIPIIVAALYAIKTGLGWLGFHK